MARRTHPAPAVAVHGDQRQRHHRPLLARWARAIGRPGLGWLFVVSTVVTLLLNGLARAETQSEALQWAEQLLNTLNQAAFLLGAILLERATRGAPADPARTRAEVTPAPAMGTPES